MLIQYLPEYHHCQWYQKHPYDVLRLTYQLARLGCAREAAAHTFFLRCSRSFVLTTYLQHIGCFYKMLRQLKSYYTISWYTSLLAFAFRLIWGWGFTGFARLRAERCIERVSLARRDRATIWSACNGGEQSGGSTIINYSLCCSYLCCKLSCDSSIPMWCQCEARAITWIDNLASCSPRSFRTAQAYFFTIGIRHNVP